MWLKASQKAFEFMVFCYFTKLSHVTIHFWKRYNIFSSISDYESLRIGGLVFAVALFLMGIALIVSKCLTTVHSRRVMLSVSVTTLWSLYVWADLTLSQIHTVLRNKQASVPLRRLEARHTDISCTVSALDTLMIRVSQQFALYTLSLSSLTVSFQGSSSYLPAHAVIASGSPETKTNQ